MSAVQEANGVESPPIVDALVAKPRWSDG